MRYVFLCTLVIGVALVYIARLINLQFVSADNYNYVSEYTYTRTEKIQAQRGEIFDRNGVALVTNEYYYNVLLDYGDIPADAVGFNGAILNVVAAAEKCGETDKLTDPAYVLCDVGGRPHDRWVRQRIPGNGYPHRFPPAPSAACRRPRR